MSRSELESTKTSEFLEIKSFLEGYFEKFLLEDIRQMQNPGNAYTAELPYKGLGFPRLMTCLAAIELLGQLCDGTARKPAGTSKDDFVRFWKVMYPDVLKSTYGTAVYKLLRCGLMHSFRPKGGLDFTFGEPERHLLVVKEGQSLCSGEPAPGVTLIIDILQLGLDLKHTYTYTFKPVALGGSSNREWPSQTLVTASITARQSEIKKIFKKAADDARSNSFGSQEKKASGSKFGVTT